MAGTSTGAGGGPVCMPFHGTMPWHEPDARKPIGRKQPLRGPSLSAHERQPHHEIRGPLFVRLFPLVSCSVSKFFHGYHTRLGSVKSDCAPAPCQRTAPSRSIQTLFTFVSLMSFPEKEAQETSHLGLGEAGLRYEALAACHDA